MKKSFAIIMLIALTGCMYGPNSQYKERRTPVENCKFLKRQTAENVEIEDKVIAPVLNDDLQHDAAVLPQEVQLRTENEAAPIVQPSRLKPQYVIIKPKDKKITTKVSKKSKAEEIKLSNIPPKQTSSAQYKQTVDAKRKEIKTLNDESKKLDVTAKAATQPVSSGVQPSAMTPPAAEKPKVIPQIASVRPLTTEPSLAAPPMPESPKPPVTPQTTSVPPVNMSKPVPDELTHGDLESNVDAFLNQKNFDLPATSQQDVSSNLPKDIERYVPGSKPMPVLK